MKWFTRNKIKSYFSHGDKNGSIQFTIHGPDKPKCNKHEIKTGKCKKCQLKREDYYVMINVVGGGIKDQPLYNDNTVEVNGIKIEIKGAGIEPYLEGKAIAIKERM